MPVTGRGPRLWSSEAAEKTKMVPRGLQLGPRWGRGRRRLEMRTNRETRKTRRDIERQEGNTAEPERRGEMWRPGSWP